MVDCTEPSSSATTRSGGRIHSPVACICTSSPSDFLTLSIDTESNLTLPNIDHPRVVEFTARCVHFCTSSLSDFLTPSKDTQSYSTLPNIDHPVGLLNSTTRCVYFVAPRLILNLLSVDTESNSTTDKYGTVVNTKFNLLICVECGVCINPQKLHEHTSKQP